MEKLNIIIKDFWVPTALHYGKVDLLKVAAEAGIQGIAKLLFVIKIAIDGEKNITVTNPDSYSCVYMQITMASVEISIWDMMTGKDNTICLSKIICNAMVSHYELWIIAGILQCNMSSAFSFIWMLYTYTT